MAYSAAKVEYCSRDNQKDAFPLPDCVLILITTKLITLNQGGKLG